MGHPSAVVVCRRWCRSRQLRPQRQRWHHATSAPPARLRHAVAAARVVNTVLPALLPRLPRLVYHELGMHVSHIPGAFHALGGNHTQARCVQSWAGCSVCSDRERRACKLYCDRAYCDSLHLTDSGYQELANAVSAALRVGAGRSHELGRGHRATRGWGR